MEKRIYLDDEFIGPATVKIDVENGIIEISGPACELDSERPVISWEVTVADIESVSIGDDLAKTSIPLWKYRNKRRAA